MTEWDGSTYVATVCKKCGRPFAFTVDRSVTGKASTTSNRPILHDQPYEDAKELHCFTSGVPLTVLGKVKNAYGNTWYLVRCTVSGKELEGYIYEKAMTGLSN